MAKEEKMVNADDDRSNKCKDNFIAERSTNNSERRLAEIINFLPDATFVIDKEGIVIAWNQAIEDLTGINAQDMLGKGNYEYAVPFYGIKRPVLVDLVLNPDPKLEKEYISLQMEGLALTGEVFLPSFGENGSYIWGKAAPMYDDSGKIIGAIESLRDITDRKQMEISLLKSEKRYHSLFDNMLDGFAYCKMLFDDHSRPVDFIYLEVNDAFERLTGLKNVVDKKVTEVIPGIRESHSELFEIYGRVALNGQPERLEIEFKPLDKWLNISVYSTEREYFVAVFEDVTRHKRAEGALRESEGRLRLAAKSAELGTYTYDFVSGQGNWSPELKALYGLRADDPLILDEDRVPVAIHPEDRPAFLAAMKAANDPYGNVDGILELDYRIMRSDGSVRWLRVHGRTEFIGEAENRRLWRAAGATIDITEHKRVEESLRESEEKYRNLVERANYGIAIIQDGTVRYANPALEKLWGGSVEETTGRPFTDFVDPDEVPKVVERYRQRMVSETVTPTTYETILIRRDGNKISAEVNAGLINFQGKPADLVLIQDITERKAVEERLFSLLRFQREMLDTATTWIDMFDAGGNIKFWNLAAERISGYSRDEVLGHTKIWEWLYPDPEYRDKMIEDVTKILLKNKRVENFETVIRLKNGEIRIISWHSSNFIDENGKRIGGIGIGVDITDSKKAEVALKAEKDRAEQYLNIAEIILVALDPDARITLLNRKGYQILGYEEDELIGRDWIETCLRPQDHDAVHETNRRIIAGEIELFEYYESYILNKKGEERLIAWHTTAIKDREGRIIGTLSSGEDVTERRKTEEKNLQLAAIVESSRDAILGTLNGTITSWNKGAERIYGYTEEEIIGQPVTILVSPERPVEVKQILERLKHGEHIEGHESLCIRKDGEQFPVDLTISPIYDKIGGFIGTSSIVREITERKRAEEKLRWNAALLEAQVESSLDGILVVDERGKRIITNQRLLTMWNVPQSIIDQEDDKALLEFVVGRTKNPDQFLEKVMYLYHHQNETSRDEVEFKNGLVVDRYSSPVIGRDGKYYGRIWTFRDITEHKRAEEAIRESEERYRNLVERANDGIIVIQDGLIKYANSRSGMIWDSTVEEIVGKSFTDYIYPAEIPSLVERYRRRMANEHVEPTYETILRRKDGSKIFVELNAGLVTYQGKAADLVIVRDITERKQAEETLRQAHDELEMRVKERTEELARKNAEMERFIYTVSHDLRTPLISMSGFLGFLKADAEKGDMKSLDADLQIVSDAITKMDKLLLDTLELSRIGRIVNPPEDVPLVEIVSEALMQSSAKISSKNVKVAVDEDLPIVQVDRLRLVEVLVNLIENSLKYMGDQTQPKIEIGKRLDGKNTVFFVRDNGIGIHPSQHDKVFELFYKVDKKSEGGGAGLAIVKKIIEVHGGRIWIESELEEGCTVCFSIPYVKDVDALNNCSKNYRGDNMKSEEP